MSKKSTLPTIELGKTGKHLSRLGLGGFHQLEISSEIVHTVVDAFEEVGGNYIETARGYGDGASEKKLGTALEGRRDRFILCSKSGAAELKKVFRLEGFFDRQMIDFMEHDPADYALRVRLSHWFSLDDQAKAEYADMNVSEKDVAAMADGIECPYGIDIPRKIRIACAKLSGGDPKLV